MIRQGGFSTRAASEQIHERVLETWHHRHDFRLGPCVQLAQGRQGSIQTEHQTNRLALDGSVEHFGSL